MATKMQSASTASRIARGPEAGRSAIPGSRAVRNDPRWAALCAALEALRDRHRRAVRIVDADCACGTLLIEAAHHARAIGFTAIEGRGIDGAPALIGRARAAAARSRNPAIGLVFEVADMAAALASEVEAPADIVLWHGARAGDDRPGVREAISAAGVVVIGDPAASGRVRAA